MTDTPNGQHPPSPGEEKKYWLDEPGNVTKIFRGLVLVCAALAAGDLFYDKHVIFPFEDVPAFFGIFGFVVCVGLVLAAKELRKILKRDEDYYDR
jgi:hypothetical protein